MNNTKDKIPVFPLNIVLFPKSLIPLFIFEERYKKMINDCIKNDSLFGVNFTEKNNFSQIGSTADIFEVIETNLNGEMNIIIEGKKRYKTISREIDRDGLMFSEIEYLNNINVNYDETIFSDAVDLYNELVMTVYKGKIKTINKFDIKWKDGTHSVSFYMAQKCGLDLNQRQKLLTMDVENDRLIFVLKYLKSAIGKLKDSFKIQDIIKSDGYIQ